MPKRGAEQVVQLSKIRIRESLRARLAEAARQSGTTMNAEIERRLEESFQDLPMKVATALFDLGVRGKRRPRKPSILEEAWAAAAAEKEGKK